jgi:hypothetical protein
VALAAIAYLVTLALHPADDPGPGPADASMHLLGREETVFDWSSGACERTDVPDQAARAYRDAQGKVHLIASQYVTRQLIGDSLSRLAHPCSVAMRSRYDPRPERFDDRRWISTPWTPNGTDVYALVHTEYQGNNHPGRCPSMVYHRCWYNAITFAQSNDGGSTFLSSTPPALVASLPYRYQPDAGQPYGLFSPSNIVRRDGYFYSMIYAEPYGAQQRGTCLMRTRTPADPGSWRAWDGHGFGVSFVNPYAFQGAAQDHICAPVARPQIEVMTQSLTFNTYLDKYVLLGSSGSRDAGRRGATWGIYFSLSDDLLHWTQRKLVAETELPWTHRCGDRDPILYPSLLDPASSSRNFETTGRRPYLYFVRARYADCRMSFDRDLMRIRVEFDK